MYRSCVTALLGLLVATSALAATPWIPPPSRIMACVRDASIRTPPCDFSQWAGFDETLTEIIFLYQNGNYALLERALAMAMVSKHRFEDGASPASAAHWAIQGMLRTAAPTTQHEHQLRIWAKAFPDSAFVPIARARLAYDSAWRVRGEGYGSSVSPESWELFRTRLNDALKTLQDAPAESRNAPIWHALLLEVTTDTPDRAGMDQIFENAAKRWPDYFDFYHRMVGRMVPRWGGSWKEVDAFINKWTERQTATQGTSLYARLYAALHRSGYEPRETLMQWPKMKESAEDLITRYPAPRHKNRYASHACYMRDRESFRWAMSRMAAAELRPDQWLRGHSHEACARWAAT